MNIRENAMTYGMLLQTLAFLSALGVSNDANIREPSVWMC